MDVVVKLNNQTAGRDKFARLLQYGSRTAWHLLEQKNSNRTFIAKLKNLEYTLSTFRKLLRLGRFMDVLYSALSSLHYNDTTVRLTSTLSKIAHALFLLTDHLLWWGRAGLARVDSKLWSRVSNKCWLYAIILNLLRDAYEIWRIMNYDPRVSSYLQAGHFNYPMSFQSAFLAECIRDHKDIVVDTVKNACDLFIPLTALGHTKLSPGTVGILGMISSIAGIASLIDPLLKLTPA